MNFEEKLNNITDKVNSNFLDGVLDKEELKIIFYKSFYRFQNNDRSKYTLGYPIKNETDSECFRITGFNIFMRMQEKIWDEIDNLCEKDEILLLVCKIKENKCLNGSETNIYNKYLLLQTSIEMTSTEILNIMYSNSDNISVKRQKLLNERFKILSISSNIGVYVNPILYSTDKDTLNKLLFLEKIINTYDKILENNFDLNKKMEDDLIMGDTSLLIKSFKDTIENLFELFESSENRNSHAEALDSELKKYFTDIIIDKIKELYKNLNTEINEIKDISKNDELINLNIKRANEIYEKIKILNEEIKKLNKEENKDDKKIKEDERKILKDEYAEITKNEFSPYKEIHSSYINVLSQNKYENMQKRLKEIGELIKIIEDYIKTDIKSIPLQFESFTSDNCDFQKLRNFNDVYLRKILAYDEVSGSVSLLFLNYFMKFAINDSFGRQVIIMNDVEKDKKLDRLKNIFDSTQNSLLNDYLIFNFDGGQNLYPPEDIFSNIKIIKVKHSDGLIKEYKLVGIAYNCGGRHSVSSVCYGDNCLSDISDNIIHEQINEDTTIEFPLNTPLKGTKLCGSNSYKIELLLYEPVETVKRLQEKLNDFKSIYINIKDIVVSGGSNSNYYIKYLKYKQKYLNLKKLKNNLIY